MSKVIIIGGGGAYADMFLKFGFTLARNFEEADLIQFTGGSDVSPHFYGQQRHRTTHNDLRRDEYEKAIFHRAVHAGKNITGICRGGQFLNVMNGGSMFQDVDEHAIGGTHKALDIQTGRIRDVTSTHHQMMIPDFKAEVVAIAHLSTRRETDTMVDTAPKHEDIEVLYYEKTKSLCFQPHPEFHYAKDCADYYKSLLGRYFDL